MGGYRANFSKDGPQTVLKSVKKMVKLGLGSAPPSSLLSGSFKLRIKTQTDLRGGSFQSSPNLGTEQQVCGVKDTILEYHLGKKEGSESLPARHSRA